MYKIFDYLRLVFGKILIVIVCTLDYAYMVIFFSFEWKGSGFWNFISELD